MPRTKKRKSPAQNLTQYARSLRNNDNKYRGKIDYKTYKRKSKKPKTIMNKMMNKIEYKKRIKKS